ncbi:protein cereblon-like [Saccostrea echinata]|uniref:protein cereblon-like n=1 Tax=Saccostrea echinata TaxID=191078 RepID=UPI002A80C538|nr:protein cereblon-like [Saccostrea echinata]
MWRKQTIYTIVKFIFLLHIVYYLDRSVIASTVDYVDYILCRNCGHEVVHPSHLIQIPSKLAHRQRNDTIGGQNGTLIQLFKNPDGVYFEVITTVKANVTETSQSSDLMTWFPGYLWTICVCPMCFKHLGWKYETTTENRPRSFFGIILANVLQQSEAESIIHIPKAYAS